MFQKFNAKLAIVLLLTALADYLFLNETIGWIAGLYASLLLLIFQLSFPILRKDRAAQIVSILLFGLCIALVEKVQILTLCLLGAGFLSLLLLRQSVRFQDSLQWVGLALRVMAAIHLQWFKDRLVIQYLTKRQNFSFQKYFALFIAPIVLFALFVALFSAANPLWLQALRQISVPDLFSLHHILFCIAVSMLLWGLLRVRLKTHLTKSYKIRINWQEKYFNQNSIFLSLVLFNILFLVQNISDLAYLWQGGILPTGITKAAYAQQGAYPLIVTTLLAAIYILIAFKDSMSVTLSKSVHFLIYLWIGQNIFLIFSAATRLHYYVEAYSLTYVRLASFIWMGLVSFGFLLIIARIVMQHNNRWLLNMNTLALIVVLYSSCFVNFDRMIADYNVRHALEVNGTGTSLDLAYLAELGTDAIPALQWFEKNQKYSPMTSHLAVQMAYALELELQSRQSDWHSWQFRSDRLLKSLKICLRIMKKWIRVAGKLYARPYDATMKKHILIVDDDAHIRDVLAFALDKAGMETSQAKDGLEALQFVKNCKPDLLILDVAMPEMDGLEVCRQVRRDSNVPILFLSSRDDEIDRIVGLEIGGDDYVTKPFSPREIVARVNAILKRQNVQSFPEEKIASLKNGSVTLDTESYSVFCEKQIVSLTATEFMLLLTFFKRPEKVFTRDELMNQSYDQNIVVSDRTIDSHIRRIRAKFKEFGIADIITTSHGIGYRLGSCQL